MQRTITWSPNGDVVHLVAEQAHRLDLGARILANLLAQTVIHLDDQLQIARGVGVGRQEPDVLDAARELTGDCHWSANAQPAGIADETHHAVAFAEKVSRLPQLEDRDRKNHQREGPHFRR